MTEIQFDRARGRGTEHKIGQLNPLGRYGVSPGGSIPARNGDWSGILFKLQRSPTLSYS